MPDSGGWENFAPDWRQRFTRWQASITALSQVYAGKAEAEMKNSAPWMDQTANARNRLFGRAELFSVTDSGFSVGFVLGHGVDYGIWLEVPTRYARKGPGPGGSYPIVGPTAEKMHEPFFNDVNEILDRG